MPSSVTNSLVDAKATVTDCSRMLMLEEPRELKVIWLVASSTTVQPPLQVIEVGVIVITLPEILQVSLTPPTVQVGVLTEKEEGSVMVIVTTVAVEALVKPQVIVPVLPVTML